MFLEDYGLIRKEDVISDKDLHGDLVRMIQEKYDISYSFVCKKREAFAVRKEKATDPSVFKNSRIKIHTAYQQKKAFVATFSNDELSVKFMGRTTADDEKSDKLEQVAKHDYKAMGKKKKDFMWLSDIFDYGVGIRVKLGRNSATNTPIYKNVNPTHRLPDPEGDAVDNDFEYHMFEMTTTRGSLYKMNEMSPGCYFNLDMMSSESFNEGTENEQKEREVRLLSGRQDDIRVVSTLDCYLTIGENKYICTLTNDRSLIIRRERILPTSKMEITSPRSIPFPINITNVFPVWGDPFGVAPMELIVDTQNAQNRLMNLAIIQEESSVFKKYLVDTDMLPNLDVLNVNTDKGPTYIAAKKKIGMDKDISGAVIPINDYQVSDQSKIRLTDKLTDIAESTTGFTKGNRGVSTTDRTLGQTRIQQQNANLMFSLDASLLAAGEEHFWQAIWYRSLVENISGTNKKIVRVSNLILPTTIEVTKDDFFAGFNPDIYIVSKRLIEEKNQQDVVVMSAQRPLIQQHPSIPAVSKKIYLRKLFEKQGVPRDMIGKYVPYTADEMRAKNFVEIINLGENPKNLFKEGMDYMTYWVYIQDCKNNDVKFRVLDRIQKGIEEFESGGQEQGQGLQNLQGVTNSLASNQLSSMIGQQGKREVSLQGGA